MAITHEGAVDVVPKVKLVTANIAAAYLVVDEDAVIRWVQRGVLKGKQACGGKWMVRTESLVALGPGGRP